MDYFTKTEAIKYLNSSKSKFDSLIKKNKINSYKGKELGDECRDNWNYFKKEELNNLNNNSGFWINIIVILFSSIIFGIILYNIIKGSWGVYSIIITDFLSNFDNEWIFGLEILFLFSLSVLIMSFSIINFLLKLFLEFKIPWFILITIFLIIILAFLGMYSITYFFNPSLNLILRNYEISTPKEVGIIECKDNSDYFLINNTINCSIKSELYNISGKVLLYSWTDNIFQYFFEGKQFSFIGKSDIKKIEFKITGCDNITLINASTSNNFEFITLDEIKTRKEKILTYTFGLLALLFISIPSIVKNFKDLL